MHAHPRHLAGHHARMTVVEPHRDTLADAACGPVRARRCLAHFCLDSRLPLPLLEPDQARARLEVDPAGREREPEPEDSEDEDERDTADDSDPALPWEEHLRASGALAVTGAPLYGRVKAEHRAAAGRRRFASRRALWKDERYFSNRAALHEAQKSAANRRLTVLRRNQIDAEDARACASNSLRSREARQQSAAARSLGLSIEQYRLLVELQFKDDISLEYDALLEIHCLSNKGECLSPAEVRRLPRLPCPLQPDGAMCSVCQDYFLPSATLVQVPTSLALMVVVCSLEAR